MDPRFRATLWRVVAAAVLSLGLVIVVGGLTETFAGNDLAQLVRKAILIGSTLGIAAWVVVSRANPASQ